MRCADGATRICGADTRPFARAWGGRLRHQGSPTHTRRLMQSTSKPLGASATSSRAANASLRNLTNATIARPPLASLRQFDRTRVPLQNGSATKRLTRCVSHQMSPHSVPGRRRRVGRPSRACLLPASRLSLTTLRMVSSTVRGRLVCPQLQWRT
jgi:hypothetical protein